MVCPHVDPEKKEPLRPLLDTVSYTPVTSARLKESNIKMDCICVMCSGHGIVIIFTR